MKHYKAATRAGSLPPKKVKTADEKIAAIMAQVIVNEETDCWEWRGALRSGYGPYRKLYELLCGKLPTTTPRTVLDHLCRVRACVNPMHLDPVTDKVNILRGDSPMAVMLRTGVCGRGHDFSGDNIITRKTGQRACRKCDNMKSVRYRAKKKFDATGVSA